jgi:hypothetical protein
VAIPNDSRWPSQPGGLLGFYFQDIIISISLVRQRTPTSRHCQKDRGALNGHGGRGPELQQSEMAAKPEN